jgi:hypothetical protein
VITLYFWHDQVKNIWAAHVICMEHIRNIHKSFRLETSTKPQQQKRFTRPRYRWMGNIKTNIKRSDKETYVLEFMCQDRDQLWLLVTTLLIFKLLKRTLINEEDFTVRN